MIGHEMESAHSTVVLMSSRKPPAPCIDSSATGLGSIAQDKCKEKVKTFVEDPNKTAA